MKPNNNPVMWQEFRVQINCRPSLKNCAKEGELLSKAILQLLMQREAKKKKGAVQMCSKVYRRRCDLSRLFYLLQHVSDQLVKRWSVRGMQRTPITTTTTWTFGLPPCFGSKAQTTTCPWTQCTQFGLYQYLKNLMCDYYKYSIDGGEVISNSLIFTLQSCEPL